MRKSSSTAIFLRERLPRPINSIPFCMVVTSVCDHGIGIPAAQQSQIFGRFFRASNLRREHSGFGLGLFIAHSIITQHGGAMRLSSVEGEGSIFSFTLPLAEV